MEICYQVNRAEFLEWVDILVREKRTIPWSLIIRCAIVPLLVVFLFVTTGLTTPLELVCVGLFSALWTAFIIWQKSLATRRVVDAAFDPSDKVKMLIDRSRLLFEYDSSDVLIKWSNVRDIVDSGNIFVIRLDKDAGYIVPKRAFSGQDHAKHFIETARAYWNAARDGTEPVLPEPLAMWPPPPQSSST